MKLELLKELLKKEEGFMPRPYRCTAGKLTIGYGRNIEDDGITKEEALYLLDNDIDELAKEIARNFPWSQNLSDSRYIVLASMLYQLGIVRLLKFKKFLAAMESGDYEKAAKEMRNSKWYKQTPGRVERLVKMLTGEYGA